MNDLEERVRRGLRTDVSGVEAERLLHDVHRGTARRRRRRAAAVVAASAVIVAGVVGVTTQLNGGKSAAPAPPATQLPTPTPSESALPGASQGVIDVSVLSPDVVFRLTTNVGCVGCSTVWQLEQSAEGGWERLHDFEGREAYGGKIDPTYGPVTNFAMAADGLNGWAWGVRLFSTHDGGRTWSVITTGPGREDNEFGHQVDLTETSAWSVLRTEQGIELWRSPLGADHWSRADAPDMSGVSGMYTVGRHVALETSDEGLSNPRVQYSTDGADWRELANPCSGENSTYPVRSAAFILCVSGDGATVYRALDLERWEVFGESSSATVYSVHALADDRLLIVDNNTATLMTPGGKTTVDLGLAPEEDVFHSSSSGTLDLLTTSSERLLASTDGGLTWHPYQ